MERIKWRRVVFFEPDQRTDLTIYRRFSYFLAPLPGEENRFLAVSTPESINYYVGSNRDGSLKRMSSFFISLYPCYVERVEPDIGPGNDEFTLINARRNRKTRDFFDPEFVARIISAPKIAGSITIAYEVVLRSGGDKLLKGLGYSFIVNVTVYGKDEDSDMIKYMLRRSLSSLKTNHGWRMRLSSNRPVIFRADVFKKTEVLMNFIRFPLDQEPE